MTTPPSMVAFEEALAEFTSTVTDSMRQQAELNLLLTERVLRLEQRLESVDDQTQALRQRLERLEAEAGRAIHAA